MPNIFYYFTIFSVFANLHVKALPPKDKAGTSDEQIVNSLADQMKEVLDSGEFADVQFLVGEEKEAIYANFPVVEIPDVEAAAFKVMLSFIYTEELSELNGDNAMAALYAEIDGPGKKLLRQKWGQSDVGNGNRPLRRRHLIKAVSHFSMSLTPAEQNYGQIEKEALALIEATDKFGPADALSRLISSKRQKNDEEDKIIASCEIEPVLDSGIKEMIRPLPITFNELVLETKQDQILQKVMKFVKNHWPEPKHFKECESFSMTFSLNFTAEEKKCHRQ
ncbi:hypothetical protein niasHT_003449 [Heterodera trifolii]|uniref:Reverse transcriptase RNase H-like domain-containing protein n=1 Tax=Heterodera trifolii TaxID=157864 RepID=A0ABD2M237_9BILA